MKKNNPLAILRAANLKAEREKLEALLWQQLRAAGLSDRFKRHQIILPDRKFEYDLASYQDRLAVEAQGGLWMQDESGRARGHAFPAAIERDYLKNDLAQIAGWRCLWFSAKAIESGEALVLIEQALGIRARAGYGAAARVGVLSRR